MFLAEKKSQERVFTCVHRSTIFLGTSFERVSILKSQKRESFSESSLRKGIEGQVTRETQYNSNYKQINIFRNGKKFVTKRNAKRGSFVSRKLDQFTLDTETFRSESPRSSTHLTFALALSNSERTNFQFCIFLASASHCTCDPR